MMEWTRTHPRIASVLLWILAAMIAWIYVKWENDPYDPLYGERTFADGETVAYKFIRSRVLDEVLPVGVEAPEGTTGRVEYWRVNSDDEPRLAEMTPRTIDLGCMGRTDLVERLAAELPGLGEMAGKYAYFIHLERGGETLVLDDGRGGPIVSRYRGDMPMLTVVLPHVLCIMLSMVIGIRAALEALRRDGNAVPLMWATIATLLLGGFVFGPIMQKHAFGVYWAGVPVGWDLTDNKVVIELAFWLLAVAFNVGRRRGGRWARPTIVLAGIVTIGIYLIPHSLLGSGYDYVAGSAVTE